MEDLLESHTHALFISRGRLNAVSASQACTSTETSVSALPGTATDVGTESGMGENENLIGVDKMFCEDMYPNLKASLLKHTVGHSVSIGGENVESDNTASYCNVSHLNTNFADSSRTSSTSRKSLNRWNESRLYQRKFGLMGTHKANLQAFKHRRQTSEQRLVDAISGDTGQLHKTYSAYPRYPRVQHQRFKNQKHSLSRTLYTNRNRSRQLTDHTIVGLSQYSSSSLPRFATPECGTKTSGYCYVSDDNQLTRAMDQDSSDEANELARRSVENHWRCNTSLRQKDLESGERDPVIGGLIRADNEDSDAYYMKKRAVIPPNSGHTGTARDLDEDDMVGEESVTSTKVISSATSRRQNHRPSSHNRKRNSRCRHFVHDPVHRRLCQLKSRQSTKRISPNQSQKQKPLHLSESSGKKSTTAHSNINAPSTLASHHHRPQNRPVSDARSRFSRRNPTHPRLSRLRVRSESHHPSHQQQHTHHNPLSRSASPSDAGADSMAAATAIGSPALLPTTNAISSNPRNRLRVQGERNDEEDSDSVASPDKHLYCLCRKLSFGDMIACDNLRCELEWFHFACVNVRVRPKGKWYCPFCRGENSKTKRT